MRRRILLLCAIIFTNITVSAQLPELFHYKGAYNAPQKSIITAGTRLVLNRGLLQQLNKNRPGHIEIQISLQQEVLVLILDKADLFSYNRPDVVLASTLKQYSFSPGYYLRGKIKGKEKSLVALSIFNDGAGGILSYNGQNYNLCVANTDNDYSSNDYILYSDKDYHATPPGCDSRDSNKPVLPPPYLQRPLNFAGCPIDMYFELAYDMYTEQGSAENVLRYFTILFNCVQTIYDNENILVQIREIKVWDIPDPEEQSTSTSMALSSFADRMSENGFNGDLAQYITYRLNGGVAWVGILCSGDYSKTAVSGSLSPSYAAFPNFSFSVEVIAHETGHNIGSNHTHSCSWPGGAIDDCYPAEGTCGPGPTPPPDGGTIMSYCHLSATGISFANGFGPLPGDLIRANVTSAAASSCICSCSNIELTINTQDIGCGSPTGIAVPIIKNGAGPFTFLWSNGTTDSVATGLAGGIHYVTVKGSNGNCTVIKGFNINSSGNAINTTLSPAASNVVKCLGETYSMSGTVSPAGTYNYQWYKDNVIITGAVNNNYTATSSGVYYMKVNNTSCMGQSQTVNVSIQNIAPFTVTANGNTSICINDSIGLSVPATTYSIEWLLNGIVLPGVVSATHYAKTAGDYSVRLYSATNTSCTRTSPAVSVQVKPKPVAIISPAADINICKGAASTISHAAVAGNTYQWYKGTNALTGETNNNLTTAFAGQYQLTVTNANGCLSKSEVANIIVNPLPDSLLTPLSYSLCQGGTLKLEVKPATISAVYNWYNANQPIGTTADNFLNVTSAGNYSVVIKNNSTGCQSSSDATIINMIAPPVIFAGNDTILATGQPYRLQVFERSNLGINSYQWSPSTGLDNAGIARPTATLLQDQLYTVTGTNALGCNATATIKLTVYKGPAIYIPNAFSPNGDGKNDLLKCFAVGLQSFKYFDVYNRSGERVFRTTNATGGWDGYFKGTPVDPGTFVWIAEGVDYTGKRMVQEGTVVVVR